MWKQASGKRRTAVLGVSVLAAVALVAPACGGGGASGEGVASVSQGEGAASKSSPRGETGQRAKDTEKAMLDFARCMRQHGVDVPDPKPGHEGVRRFEAPTAGTPVPGDGKFMEADKACRHLMGDAGPPQLSPEDHKQLQDAMLAFARCMRDHGVDMPDPQPGGGGGIVAKVGEGADPRSPAFQAAEKECRRFTEAIDKKLGVTRSDG